MCHHQPAFESRLATLVPGLPSAGSLLFMQLCVSGEQDGRIIRTLHCLTLTCWACDSPGQSTGTASTNEVVHMYHYLGHHVRGICL